MRLVGAATMHGACRKISVAAAGASAPAATAHKFTGSERIARWSLRLAHDNTFLSYARNAIIATVAGTAMYSYRKGDGRPPLAAAGLLTMGGLYIYIGSGLYVWQIFRLKQELGIGPFAVAWACFNALWPVGLWSVSLACLLDETPEWLLDGLCHMESHLPAALRSRFFLPSASLVPIVRVLDSLHELETMRLQTVLPEGLALEPQRNGGGLRHGLQRSSTLNPNTRSHQRIVRRGSEGSAGTLLSNHDYATVITQRLERLTTLQCKLKPLASGEDQALSTSMVMPLLDHLQTTVTQLEIALEADVRRCQTERARWWFNHAPTPRERLLTNELEAARVLNRRCEAVKRDNVAID